MPGATRLLFGISAVMQHYWYVGLLGGIGGFVAYKVLQQD